MLCILHVILCDAVAAGFRAVSFCTVTAALSCLGAVRYCSLEQAAGVAPHCKAVLPAYACKEGLYRASSTTRAACQVHRSEVWPKRARSSSVVMNRTGPTQLCPSQSARPVNKTLLLGESTTITHQVRGQHQGRNGHVGPFRQLLQLCKSFRPHMPWHSPELKACPLVWTALRSR